MDDICRDCKSSRYTRVSMQVDKTSRRKRITVRFRVDCDRCGAFSHFLKSTEINKAVAKYISEQHK